MKKEMLSELILGMNKQEKAFFSRSVYSGGKKKPLIYVLYEDIEKGKKVASSSSYQSIFRVVKHQLLEQLIDSLSNANEAELKDALFFKKLNHCRLLYSKGFITECLKRLSKLIDTLKKKEVFNLLHYALLFQNSIFKPNPDFESDLINNEKELIRCMELLQVDFEYNHILSQIYLLRNKIGSFTHFQDSDRKMLDEIMKSKWMKSEKYKISSSTICSYYTIWICYYTVHQNKEKMLEYTRLVIEEYESNTDFKEEQLMNYFVLLNDYMNNLMRLKKYKELDEKLKGLDLLPPFKSAIDRSHIFNFLVNIKFNYYTQTAQRGLLKKLLESTVAEVDTHINYINEWHFLTCYANIIISSFEFGYYTQVTRFCVRILKIDTSEKSMFYKIAFLYLLMSDYNTKDLISLKKNIKYYYRMKSDSIYNLFVPYFEQLIVASTLKQKKEIIRDWKLAFSSLSQENQDLQLLKVVGFENWFENI